MTHSAERLRVLVVSLGRRGGTTQYGWMMSRGLAEHVDVAVISASGAENRERWSEIGCPHLEIETFSSIPTMLASFLSIRRFAAMRRFARRFSPDIVYYPHGHAWKPLLDLVLPRSAKTVLTIHDPELHSGEDSALHRLLDSVNRRHVDGYVLLNETQRGGFVQRLRLDQRRVAVVPLGALNDPLEACVALSELPGLEAVAPHSGRYALFAGRIRHYKGLETLLDARRLLSPDREIPLVIAGAGAMSDEERSLLAEPGVRPSVLIDRWLTDVEFVSLVAAARFVILPYRSATQSGIIPLASSFGVPAVASAAGGIGEQVVDRETGLLFPPGDARALSLRLEAAFDMDDRDYARMSDRCRRRAEVEWAWSPLAARLVAFFEEIRAL